MTKINYFLLWNRGREVKNSCEKLRKMLLILKIKKKLRNFLEGPVVKALPSNAEDAGSITGQGSKFPHPLKPKNQNRKKYCHKLNKNFKNVSHRKNLKKEKKKESG